MEGTKRRGAVAAAAGGRLRAFLQEPSLRGRLSKKTQPHAPPVAAQVTPETCIALGSADALNVSASTPLVHTTPAPRSRSALSCSNGRAPQSKLATAGQHCGSAISSVCKAARSALSKLRLTAYTSEVGESLRPVISPWKVTTSYGISWAYVLLDVIFRGFEAHEDAPDSRGLLLRTVAHSSIFHTVATMLVPAVFIHSVVHASQHILHHLSQADSSIWLRWAPTSVGFGFIPLIPVLLDPPVEALVDHLFRVAWPLEAEKRRRRPLNVAHGGHAL